MIDLDSGTLYITNLDGSTTTLNNVSEINMTVEEDDNPEQIYINKIDLKASFDCITHSSKEAILAITGIKDAVLKCCSNKRVRHLALHSRKKRTRKKNLHRIFKILEEK